METLLHDLRHGLRLLLKTPGFTTIAIISLALGIGANTALFSVVDAMLLKMLPVKEPDRLVLFRTESPRGFNPGGYTGGNGFRDPVTGQLTMRSFPYQSFLRVREQPGALSDIIAFGNVFVTVTVNGQSTPASGQAVSGNYFNGFGVQPLVGRTFTDEDDKPGASPVIVLGHRYWQQNFNSDPSIVGKQIDMNNVAFTVIGVTPAGFEGTMNVGTTQDVTIPIAFEPQLVSEKQRSRMYGAGIWWLRLIGRLKPGATAEQARAQLENVFLESILEHRAARSTQAVANGENPIGNLNPREYPRLFLDPGGQGETVIRQSFAPSLYLLLGVVGLVLLIACANVAGLLLSRASVRQKEIALRLALGASRWRLIRQLLTESMLLSMLSGLVGILLALWFKNGLLAVSDWAGRGMRGLEPQLDLRVLGFTSALSLLTGIIFGIAPAWRTTNVDLTPALKDSGRSSSSGSRSLLGRGLVVMQVALSLLLLVGAGLFVRTLVNLQHVDPGFNTNNLVLVSVQPEQIGYREGNFEQFYKRMTDRLQAEPGVRTVTFSTTSLLSESWSADNVYLRSALDAPPDSDGRIKPSGITFFNQVGDNFLEAMQIPLLAGRNLRAQDDARSPSVVVVNQTFARMYFPNENPIGKRFTSNPKKPDEIEIVGLAAGAKYGRQRDDVPPTIYKSWRQQLPAMGNATFEVRIAGDPTTAVSAIRRIVSEIDSRLPINDIRTQNEQIDRTLRMERLFAKLLTMFGLLAQLLAAIGLFGVIAYSVSQRTREIGIRMALGAERSDILKMILRQGTTLILMGVAVGVAGAFILTRYLESKMNLSHMLFGVRLSDPLTYGVTIALLVLVAMVACYIPARRGTRVDPMVALKYE